METTKHELVFLSSPPPHELNIPQQWQSHELAPLVPLMTSLINETLSRSQTQRIKLSQLSQIFSINKHMGRIKRKKEEALTKCRGGGGVGRANAGLQVISLGILGFSLLEIFASKFRCSLLLIFSPSLFMFLD